MSSAMELGHPDLDSSSSQRFGLCTFACLFLDYVLLDLMIGWGGSMVT
jgi:hypothetical protein